MTNHFLLSLEASSAFYVEMEKIADRMNGDAPRPSPFEKMKSIMEPGDIILVTRRPVEVGRPPNRNLRTRVRDTVGDRLFNTFGPLTTGSYEHVALYVGDGQVVEAYDDGIIRRDLPKAIHNRGYAIMRPKMPAEVRQRAAEFAEKQVGKPYDFPGAFGAASSVLLPRPIAGVVAGRLLKAPRDPASQNAFTCSALVGASYASAGVDVTKKSLNWRFAAPSHIWAAPQNEILLTRNKQRLIRPPSRRATVYPDIKARLEARGAA